MPNNHDHPKTGEPESFQPDSNEEQGQVQILPPEERENFQGMTIDTGATGQQEENRRNYYEYEYYDPQKRVYVRHVKLNSGGFWNWLVLGLLATAIILIAAPLFLFIVIPFSIMVILSNLLRRR